MNRAVLWDLDGTLVDSAEYHWIAWRDTLAAAGVGISYAQFLESFGQKNDRILASWLPGTPSPETIQRLGDAKEAAYRRLAVTHGLAPLPGAAEWVARLQEAGWLASHWEQIDPVRESRPARRYYRLTPEGARQAQQALAELHAQTVPLAKGGKRSARPAW